MYYEQYQRATAAEAKLAAETASVHRLAAKELELELELDKSREEKGLTAP
jgi:hypothetical protein